MRWSLQEWQDSASSHVRGVYPVIIWGTTSKTRHFIWILMPLITLLVSLFFHFPTAWGQRLHHGAVCLSVPPTLHANQERLIWGCAETPFWCGRMLYASLSLKTCNWICEQIKVVEETESNMTFGTLHTTVARKEKVITS